MERIITEIEIMPVRPNSGLVAFASFILFRSLYCSSVGIFTRPGGGFRLLYPNKKAGTKDISVFHPITKDLGDLIEKEVTKVLEEVMNNDRYNFAHNTTERF